MFTGIVQGKGEIVGIERQGQGARFRIQCPSLHPMEWSTGDSVAVSGCCLTALDLDSEGFGADLSGETLTRTTLGQASVGDSVNLEPALRVGDAIGGHYVTGHVDAVAQIHAVEPLDGGNRRIEITIPQGFEHLVAKKGSVTLDGVSLTINDVMDHADHATLSVNIIPHTWKVTTLGQWTVGQGVNFEVDLLARYLDRLRLK